jgi:hypothetical protein
VIFLTADHADNTDSNRRFLWRAYICHMTRSSLLWALAIALVGSNASSASELPIKVDLNQLIKHPKKYNGKRVEVTGYWVTSCAHCSDLYPSFEAEQRSPLSGKWVYLGRFAPNIEMSDAFRKRISKPYPDYDGYVRVVGKFEAVDMQKPKVISRSDNVERVIITQGFGWMGTESKQITQITKLEPIGPPLPSNIDAYLERLAKSRRVRSNTAR